MPEGSDEATIEEELAELKGESEGSTDADLAELEAELDAEDGLGGAGEDGTGVGLDSDPSEQYADLLDDRPTSGAAGGAGASADATDDAADGSPGLLGRLFGGGGGSDPAHANDARSQQSAASTGEPADEYADLLDDSTGESRDAASEAESQGGLGARLARYFSPKWFLGATVVMLLFGGAGSTFVPVVGGPVGLAAGALLVGLVADERKHLETAVAGALLGALASVGGAVSVAFATGTVTRIAAVGAGVGLVAALVGAYFGRDLRGAIVGESGSSPGEREPPRP